MDLAILWRPARLAAALLLAAGAAGCALGAGPPQVRPEPPPPPETGAAAVVIVDADAHGAILFDPAGQAYRGIRRDGTRAWRAPADPAAPIAVACAARCPDAVLSGSVQALVDPDVPDPEPGLLHDGRRRSLLAGASARHRRLLTAATERDYVAATSDDARRWRVEIHRPGRPAGSTRVDGALPTWQQSPDGRIGLLTTTGVGDTGDGPPLGARARWFVRRDGGWEPAAPTVDVAGNSACVADDGRALLLGQAPAILRVDGRQEPVTDLDHASDCALTRFGAVVAELTQRAGAGPQARVRAVDARGVVVWRRDLPGEVAVAADPTAPRAAWLYRGTLAELDLRTGRELRTLAGVAAARYDGSGGLVTAGPDGAPTWREGEAPAPP
jgi:hypothetical protein